MAHGSWRTLPELSEPAQDFRSSGNPYLEVHKNPFARSLSRRLKEPSPHVIPYVIAIEGNIVKRIFLLYVSSIAHTHSLNWTVPISHATVNKYSLEM